MTFINSKMTSHIDCPQPVADIMPLMGQRSPPHEQPEMFARGYRTAYRR